MTPTTNPPTGHVALDGHIADDRLVDLALAEPPVRDEATHLAACRTCAEALGSLVRAVEGARGTAGIELVSPPSHVWTRIGAEIDADGADVDDAGADHSGADRSGADRSTSEVVVPLRRADARRAEAGRSKVPRRRPALGWLAAACAAGVLLGAGGLLAAERLQDPGVDAGRTVATAELDTLDTGQRLGSAIVSAQEDGVVLDVSTAQLDTGDAGYVEVWLLNRDGKRLVSVGVLGDDARSGSFPISQRLLDEGYTVVDISREQFDDKPQHSGDSIVRGSLTTPA